MGAQSPSPNDWLLPGDMGMLANSLQIDTDASFLKSVVERQWTEGRDIPQDTPTLVLVRLHYRQESTFDDLSVLYFAIYDAQRQLHVPALVRKRDGVEVLGGGFLYQLRLAVAGNSPTGTASLIIQSVCRQDARDTAYPRPAGLTHAVVYSQYQDGGWALSFTDGQLLRWQYTQAVEEVVASDPMDVVAEEDTTAAADARFTHCDMHDLYRAVLK